MPAPRRPLTDPLSIAYIAWCESERVPVNTVKRRTATLRTIGIAGVASREDVELWWSARADRSPATRANDLANLRTFYRWCQRWEHRSDDPTLRLDAPRVPNGLPRPTSRADLHKLLQVLPDDLRRAAVLGAYAGLRVSEAAHLHWHDIDLEQRRARVRGKGQKLRVVALSLTLLDHLLPDTGFNVVTGTEQPMSGDQLRTRVNRAIKAAGVDDTFHNLRHRYGTLAYQATGDLLAVGRQMGHASPTTTAVYAQVADDVADRIADAVVR